MVKRLQKSNSKNRSRAKANAKVSSSRHNIDLRIDFGSPTQGYARMHTAPTPKRK